MPEPFLCKNFILLISIECLEVVDNTNLVAILLISAVKLFVDYHVYGVPVFKCGHSVVYIIQILERLDGA